MSDNTFAPGPSENTVRTADGKVLFVPDGWVLLPPGDARHSETEEELVVYRQDYGERGLWVRPLAMFEATVESDGEAVPRFQFVDDNGKSTP